MFSHHEKAVDPEDLLGMLQRSILQANDALLVRQEQAWRAALAAQPLQQGMEISLALGLSEVVIGCYVDRYPPRPWKRWWIRWLRTCGFRVAENKLWLVGPKYKDSATRIVVTAELGSEGQWDFRTDPGLETLRSLYGPQSAQ